MYRRGTDINATHARSVAHLVHHSVQVRVLPEYQNLHELSISHFPSSNTTLFPPKSSGCYLPETCSQPDNHSCREALQAMTVRSNLSSPRGSSSYSLYYTLNQGTTRKPRRTSHAGSPAQSVCKHGPWVSRCCVGGVDQCRASPNLACFPIFPNFSFLLPFFLLAPQTHLLSTNCQSCSCWILRVLVKPLKLLNVIEATNGLSHPEVSPTYSHLSPTSFTPFLGLPDLTYPPHLSSPGKVFYARNREQYLATVGKRHAFPGAHPYTSTPYPSYFSVSHQYLGIYGGHNPGDRETCG